MFPGSENPFRFPISSRSEAYSLKKSIFPNLLKRFRRCPKRPKSQKKDKKIYEILKGSPCVFPGKTFSYETLELRIKLCEIIKVQ
jgi:hypothetical protein